MVHPIVAQLLVGQQTVATLVPVVPLVGRAVAAQLLLLLMVLVLLLVFVQTLHALLTFLFCFLCAQKLCTAAAPLRSLAAQLAQSLGNLIELLQGLPLLARLLLRRVGHLLAAPWLRLLRLLSLVLEQTAYVMRASVSAHHSFHRSQGSRIQSRHFEAGIESLL